tara:strand:- start:59 stop:559 length:501 start_codon:yes stop_codon:yes gene_type:complete
MVHRLIYNILFFQLIFAQGIWYSGNLKGIDDFTMELNVKGIDDSVWEKRVSSFIMLRFLENDIRIVKDQMPKLVIDVNIVDSRVEKVSSFLVIFSLYNYSISEPNYYQSMADTLITKRLMTSKVFSHEVMGQSSTQNLYRDVEKSINKLISIYLDQWFRDNPLKQF